MNCKFGLFLLLSTELFADKIFSKWSALSTVKKLIYLIMIVNEAVAKIGPFVPCILRLIRRLTLLHPERPKLYGVFAVLSATGLTY